MDQKRLVYVALAALRFVLALRLLRPARYHWLCYPMLLLMLVLFAVVKVR